VSWTGFPDRCGRAMIQKTECRHMNSSRMYTAGGISRCRLQTVENPRSDCCNQQLIRSKLSFNASGYARMAPDSGPRWLLPLTAVSKPNPSCVWQRQHRRCRHFTSTVKQNGLESSSLRYHNDLSSDTMPQQTVFHTTEPTVYAKGANRTGTCNIRAVVGCS
jgi:hypothetical protein